MELENAVNQPEVGTDADIVQRLLNMDKPAEPAKPATDSDRESDNADAEDEGNADNAEVEGNDSQGNPADADDAEDSADNETTDEPEYFTVKINGKEEKVTREELVAGYQKEQDYRRKTMDLARKAEETDARAKEVSDLSEKRTKTVEELGVLTKLVEGTLLTEAQLARLRAENPSQYLLAKDENDARQRQIQALRNRSDEVTAEQKAADDAALEQTRVTERQKLLETMPSLEKKETQAKFMDYARNQGYTDDQIASTLDHRIITAFEKARLYDDMQAKAKSKPDHTVPKVMKGNAQRQTSREMNASKVEIATKRARKTGSMDDVVALMLARQQQRT